MKKCVLLALSAGALCSVAIADGDWVVGTRAGDPVGFAQPQSAQPFGTRIPKDVYSTKIGNGGDWRASQCTTAFAEKRIGDDFTVVTPPGTTFPLTTTGGIWMALLPAGAGNPFDPTNGDVTIRHTIYDNFTGFVGGAFPGTSQIGVVNWDQLALLPPEGGFFTWLPASNPYPAGTTAPVLLDANGFATTQYLVYQTSTNHAGFAPYGRGATSGIVAPGTSNAQRWLDCDNNGIVGVAGNFTGPGGLEVNAAGTAPNLRGMYFAIQADVACSTQPTAVVVGSLADGTTTRTGTAALGGAVWYDITIGGDATDAARRFLDIDTESSATNVAIGIYGTNAATNCGQGAGALGQHFDDDSGSGTNAQLTFGTGRRSSVADGLQYDGRDGEITAGRYLVAVAPAGSTFGAEYNVGIDPLSTNVGPYTIHFTTNTGSGLLAGSVAPDLIAGGDIGCLGTGTSPIAGATYDVLAYSIGWYKFAVSDIPAAGAAFLDIDFQRSVALGDPEAAIFDSTTGNVLFASDDWVVPAIPTYDNPGFSFGSTASPRSSPNIGGPANYQGQNGALAAGEYYMGVGLFNVSALVLLDRWHLRTNSGSGLDISPDFIFGGLSGCTLACDTIDFNGDGVSPDSLDIEDYLSVFGGGLCSNAPFCGDIDFNNDGVSPDSGDIDGLLSLFGGGPCPL